jgi:hypothetical protein
MATKDRSGYLTWKHGRTWFRVIGDLRNGQIPIVVMHGGPGGTHVGVLSMAKLLNASGRPVLYRQQPPMPSAIMINPMTGQQQVTYGPQYVTTTKILGGKSRKKGGKRTRRRATRGTSPTQKLISFCVQGSRTNPLAPSQPTP